MRRTRFVLVGAGAAWLVLTVLACDWFGSDLQKFSGPGAPDATGDNAQPADSAPTDAPDDALDAGADAARDGTTAKDSAGDAEDAADAGEKDAPEDAGEDVD